jgi:hypothetical protein
MTCTDGSIDAHETPVTVVAVGFPAASLSVTVMSKGALPGHVTSTQASVFTAVTGAVPTQVAEPPSDTHRLFTAAPSEAGRFAASEDVVCPHTLNRPWESRSVGPRNCPSVGRETVRLGAVVSTG